MILIILVFGSSLQKKHLLLKHHPDDTIAAKKNELLSKILVIQFRAVQVRAIQTLVMIHSLRFLEIKIEHGKGPKNHYLNWGCTCGGKVKKEKK